MKTKMIFYFLFFCSSFTYANISEYFDLKIGNIYVYNCIVWVSAPPYGCDGSFRIRTVITDTVTYAGKKYYRYNSELIHISGTCNFSSFMFPFYVGNYNTIRIDTLLGTIYYYNPGNGCTYSPNETMIDSLNSHLNDSVKIRCVSSPYSYACIDTVNKRKYYNSGSFQGELRREYVQGIGLVDNYRHITSSTSGLDEQTLVGRVINGIVYGDTAFLTVGVIKQQTGIPEIFSLSQNYPNPFNPTTKIKFDIPPSKGAGGMTRLFIYDALGKDIATLVNEQLSPGTYSVEWDGTNYPSGVYFYKLITNDFTETRKMVLMK